MTRRACIILAMFALGSTEMAAAGAQVLADDGALPGLNVLMINRAEIPPDVLKRAQDETVRIYAVAGVSLEWMDQSVTRPASAFHLAMVVVPYTHAGRPADMMGAAPTTTQVSGRIAYAFYDRIERFTRRKRADTAQVLGCIIAHELGHLLLGFGAHTTDGIMRGQWDGWELDRLKAGLLTFTKQEARAIQKRLGTSRP